MYVTAQDGFMRLLSVLRRVCKHYVNGVNQLSGLAIVMGSFLVAAYR
jgi:hypothetical protein